ncbi:phosphoglucosamine mutase [Halobacteriales archaeon SW_6_65_46]|nr:MAG: phosphoglucosamine mutase [Halobacteriales archaeon SW_6_65_46]
MFGTSGIRGPVGETVTASVALDVGRALGAQLTARGESRRVVVGRDPRNSGRLLLDALAAGLRETGTDVLDAGVAATPTVARAVGPMEAGAGVVVTASHNPAPDNGLKLWQPSGQAFDGDRRADIERRIAASDWTLEPWDGLGSRTQVDVTEHHHERLIAAADAASERVVVDLGNGAGGVTVDVLAELGCEVETLNARPDGSFPGRPSEPTAEHCGSLAALVRESDATVGLAHDGDADRLRAVAGDGTYLSGDVTLALFAADAASAGERVAVPVDTSLAVEEYLAARDIDVERTPVGDTHVAAAATAPEVTFGGEPSGAWIWPAETLCPDGPYAACKLVELAATRPLAERASEIPTYPIERGSVAVEAKTAAMERLRERLLAAYDDARVSTLDGVRVTTDDGWFLLRASGTQPLIRVTAEAREQERATALFEMASEYVEAASKG